MPYTVISNSNIFPEQPVWPPVYESETKASYVEHKTPRGEKQPYRLGSRPSTASTLIKQEQPAADADPAKAVAQLQALAARLVALQTQLDGADASVSQDAIDAVSAELASLELKLQASGVKPASVMPAGASQSGFIDSFAQFASEAHRVRDSGRIPFASDKMKMR